VNEREQPLAMAKKNAENSRTDADAGSAPTIRYFDLLMVIDNEAKTVSEYSVSDRRHRTDGAK
jgi:hypothetical protein